MKKIYEITAHQEWKDIKGNLCKRQESHWAGFYTSKKKAIAEIEQHLGWLIATNKTNNVKHYNNITNQASYEYNGTCVYYKIIKHDLF